MRISVANVFNDECLFAGDGTLLVSESVVHSLDDFDQTTLLGPNKPLPPTPTDQSPASEQAPSLMQPSVSNSRPGDDGTLVARDKRVS